MYSVLVVKRYNCHNKIVALKNVENVLICNSLYQWINVNSSRTRFSSFLKITLFYILLDLSAGDDLKNESLLVIILYSKKWLSKMYLS